MVVDYEYKTAKIIAAGCSVSDAGDVPVELEAEIPGCGGVLDDEDYWERVDKGIGLVEREDKIDLNSRGKGYRVCAYGRYCPEEEEEYARKHGPVPKFSAEGWFLFEILRKLRRIVRKV